MKVRMRVVPQSGRQKITLDTSGVIKCYLNSPAEDGKANKELIKLLSTTLDIAQKDIEIVQGLTSRSKMIEIHGFLTEQDLYTALGLQIQGKIF